MCKSVLFTYEIRDVSTVGPNKRKVSCLQTRPEKRRETGVCPKSALAMRSGFSKMSESVCRRYRNEMEALRRDASSVADGIGR